MTAGRSQVLGLARASGERARRNRFRYIYLTPAQRAFVECDAREVLWRDGNQVGKSLALAWLVISLCLGIHPTIQRRVPVKVMVVSVSREQMVPLMEKLWELAPISEVTYGEWDPGRGLVGKPPRLVFRNGSQVIFATYNQGAKRVAGDTVDVVVMDEPPPEGLYGEIPPRVLRRRGLVRTTFTPTPDMPDQAWFRDKVARERGRPGGIVEFNWGLSAEMLHPEGYPAPWLEQWEIDAYAESLLEAERAMRIRGSWDPLVTGRYLQDFDRGRHVQRVPVHTLRGWYLVVGLDHGTVAGKQTATLVAFRGRDTDRPEVRYLRETVSEGVTTPEHDAEAILDMLDDVGVSYDDVDEWVGDVPTQAGMGGPWEVRKSNRDLRKELARQLRRPVARTKFIHEPAKWASSLTYTCRLMNTLFQRDAAVIDESMVQFIAACERFKGDKRDPLKDVLDAGRYATQRACTGRILPALHARY